MGDKPDVMKQNPETTRLIREALKKNPRGLNILQIAEKTGINRMSAGRYLDVMAAQGLVDIQKVGNAKVYFLSRQIPVTTYMQYTSKHYCITDSSLTIVQINEWIPETVGMADADFIGRSLPDVLDGVVVNLGECREAMEKALAGEVGTVIVEENYRGRHKFFEILHMPVQFPDGSNGMMAISQDITDKKKLEIALREQGKLYRSLVEHVPAVVFALDAEWRIVYISPRVTELGYVPDTLVGRPFVELVDPKDQSDTLAELAAAWNKGSGTGITFRIADKGREVWVKAACIVMQETDGTCTGITGLFRNMSEMSLTGGNRAQKDGKKRTRSKTPL
ncbi:MAG: PAS domain S-box protein [Methanoregula sp.]